MALFNNTISRLQNIAEKSLTMYLKLLNYDIETEPHVAMICLLEEGDYI